MIAPNTSPAAKNPLGTQSPAAARPRRGRPRRRSLWILGAAAAALAGIVVALIVIARQQRSSLPRVTAELLDAAGQRWSSDGPKSYDMEISLLVGGQTGKIELQVRDGQVTAMRRDGQVPRQKRTWSYWSVPNQLEMIRADLEHRENPRQAFGVSDPSQVELRADFHPLWGYPKKYHRQVLGGKAEIGWEITRFQVVGAATDPNHPTDATSVP